MTHTQIIEVLRACLMVGAIDNYVTDEEYKVGLKYLDKQEEEECNLSDDVIKRILMMVTYYEIGENRRIGDEYKVRRAISKKAGPA